MIGLLAATEAEAAPLVALLGASKLTDEPFATYVSAGGGEFPAAAVVVSGMGRQAAGRAAEYLIDARGATVVVNVGACGALTPGLAPGEVLGVWQVADGEQVLAGGEPGELACPRDAWSDLPAGRLVTVDEAVFQPQRRSRLAERADLVDMEGLGVALACRRRGVPCYLVKGITDLADGDGKQDIQRNMPRVSAALAEVVVRGLARLRGPGPGGMRSLLRFVKIEHNVFSLPLLVAGAWLGAGRAMPSWRVLGLILVAGVGARALGMAMNRILDRRLDALNKRTAGRELPSGRMSLGRACLVAGAGLGLYLLACWGLGPLCLMLSPVPGVALIAYSLLKRFTSLCHFGIGLCMAMAPLAAFVAASGSVSFDAPVLLLALFTFCWLSGFDVIYALQDLQSDRRTRVHSLPASLGPAGAQAVAAGVHLVAVAAIARLWWILGGGALSGAALLVAIGAFLAGYVPRIPLPVRFFPVSAVAGVAGAMIPLLGGLP